MKNISSVVKFFGILVVGISFDVLAQEEEFPDELRLFEDIPTVITAAKKEQPITEAPASVTVITAEQIRNLGADRLSDVLALIPGVQITTHRKGFERIWIRGISAGYNDKILLLIDGYPYRELVYGAGAIDEELPVNNVKRVEFVKGPGSALYGLNAFAGIINVITMNPDDVQETIVEMGLGAWNLQQYNILFSKKSENKGILFSGTFYDTEGDRHERDREGEPTKKRDPNNRVDLNLKVSISDLTFSISHNRFNRQYLTYNDNTWMEWYNETNFFRLSWNRSFTDKLKLTLRSYYNLFDYPRKKRRWKEKSGIKYLDKIEDTEEKSRVIGSGVLMEYTLSEDNNLIAGIDYEDEKALEIRESFYKTKNEKPEVKLSRWIEPAQPSNENWALFLENIWKVNSSICLTAGIRYDRHNQYGSQINPRGAVIYNPKKNVTAKFLYGRAFRAPSYRELYVVETGHSENGNIDLKPEYIETMEMNLDYRINPKLKTYIALFKNSIKDFIDVNNTIGKYDNLGRFETQGLESEMRFSFLHSKGSVFINYTRIFKAENGNGNVMPDIAEEMANAGINAKIGKHLNINCILMFIGRRNRAFDYQADIAPENKRDNLGGYKRVNLVLTSRDLPVEILAGVFNVFDVRSFNPSYGRGDYDVEHSGRDFLIRIGYKF